VDVYNYGQKKLKSTFHNIDIMLRIYLCIMVSNWREIIFIVEDYKESSYVHNESG
jgi:hypothetical protein